MKKRNQIIRRKVFERDNFTCQKCKLLDKTAKSLEVHHLIPIIFGGKDEINNLITLCSDCHHFSPNTKEEFGKYVLEECNGTMTTFIQSLEKVRKEHPELFESNKNGGESIKSLFE